MALMNAENDIYILQLACSKVGRILMFTTIGLQNGVFRSLSLALLIVILHLHLGVDLVAFEDGRAAAAARRAAS